MGPEQGNSNQIKRLHPFTSEKIRVLLLENLNPAAEKIFLEEGFEVDKENGSLCKEDLIKKISGYHVIGIRSQTQLTDEVLSHAKKLVAVGCYCIGTNQVDLEAAQRRGICVFNSPFSNSRSVAEMVIGYIIMLSRKIIDRNSELKQGIWKKVSKNCHEVRGKTLGIIGYGHIGSQLSVLAESLGMSVIWYDIKPIMPIGNSRRADTMDAVLSKADFVSLHVPSLPSTVNLIGAAEIKRLKRCAIFINASRGPQVDVDALAEALKSGHLAGAAVDVYPKEPSGYTEDFVSPLQSCPNTILTPHIGGSTEEAQEMIGLEVSYALKHYVNHGTSTNSVNYPHCQLRPITIDEPTTYRIVNVHRNVPGVLKKINEMLSPYNIEKQVSDSSGPIAYLLVDINIDSTETLVSIYQHIKCLPESVSTRLLL